MDWGGGKAMTPQRPLIHGHMKKSLKKLFPAKLVEQGETDTKEQDCTNRPDGPGDPAILVDINTDKEDTEHAHNGNLVPPFLLAAGICGFISHDISPGY
jgi:hypothetical protein